MKNFILSLAMIMAVSSCCSSNPFLTEWDTPYGIPDFNTIRECHYLPAIEAGIAQQQAEIDAICANEAPATFENVIGAFEHSGAILTRVTNVLFNVSESDGTDSLQKIVEQALPLISEHSDNIYMNPALYAKVKAVYDNMDVLDREQQMCVKKIYNAFVKNGISLDEAGQARMREINKELSALEFAFGNNTLAENNAFESEFGVSISEYPTAMGGIEDRALREKMFKAYANRGNNGNANDNKANIVRIMELRLEKAKLLGYDTPAHFILHDKMAGNPEAVMHFLADLMDAAVVKAKSEVVEMQKFMDEDIAAGKVAAGSVIRPWDWAYYAEKVRKAKYALDEEQTKPYFKMENVRAGVFATASKLYGLQFEALKDIPKYNPEVEGFKVTDADGSLIGVLLTDYYPRATKRGGAWMTNFVEQYRNEAGEDVRPVIVNVGNFAKPTADAPSLLTLDQVSTMFHEFGHALHGLLSKCRYTAVSGTNVARDFVELPSQINENWAFQPEVLATYAFHYQTGEVIPAELVEKINAAGTFNQGFMTTELVAASILDMKWHLISSTDNLDVEAFEAQACKDMGIIDEIIPRYRSTYFNHIFTGGYSAGYYSYLWAEVLDKDAFELFRQNGIFDHETAMSFRHNILEKGGSEEPMVLYERFRGQTPDPAALLRARGLM